ncbi:MAG: hypothetical protein QM817_00545 [Archangium sp.]
MSSGALLAMVMAASPALQLEWHGAPECPSRDDFLADVRRLRGDVREATGADAVAIDVTLSNESARWRAVVVAGAGRRELEADTCAEVVAAAAVVVSLALAEPEGVAVPTPAPVPPPVAPTNVFSLGLTGGARIGPLPSPTPGASLAAALTFGALRFELSAATPFSQSVKSEGSAAQISWWLSARFAGCYEFSFGRVVLGPCVLAHAAWLEGRGIGGAANGSASGALVALSGGALVRARLFSSLWLRFDGSGGAALTRPRFVTTTDGVKTTVAEPAPWLVDLQLGFEWRFE